MKDPYFAEAQENFRSLFTAEGLEIIEKLFKNKKTRKRHPIVRLLYSNDERFVHQELYNILHCWSKIYHVNPNWLADARTQERMLSEEIEASASLLGELKAYGYLLDVFSAITPVPEAKTKTPDFRVAHAVDSKIAPVFVEVHSMAWSEQMTQKTEKFESEFEAGTIGTVRDLGGGIVRSAAMLSTPFSGENADSSTEDAVSKIAGIGKKANQIPANHAGVLWLNFDQDIWAMELTSDDCFPVFSRAGGDIFSGKIWQAVYGAKGNLLYEPFPSERDQLVMRHDGIFKNYSSLSAIVISLSNQTMLLENPCSTNPLPEWFRLEFIGTRWFKSQFSRMAVPGFDLKGHIESEQNLSQCFRKYGSFELH